MTTCIHCNKRIFQEGGKWLDNSTIYPECCPVLTETNKHKHEPKQKCSGVDMAVGPDVTVTVEVKLPVTNRTIYPVYNGEECDEGFFFFSQRQADSLAEDLEPQRKHLARLDDERIVLYTEMNPYENCPRNRWPDYKYLGHGKFYCYNGSWN